ncbi:hypothetical protein RCL1_003458 [Eukaryota sp. TZLM3-RCL]
MDAAEFPVNYLHGQSTKLSGILVIDGSSVRFSAVKFRPVIIPHDKVAAWYRSSAASRDIVLKIVTTSAGAMASDPKAPGHIFEFTSSNKVNDRDVVVDLLTRLCKPVTSKPSSATPTPPSQPQGQPRDDLGLELSRRRALLSKFPALELAYSELVSKSLLSELEFWTCHRDLIDFDSGIYGSHPSISSSLPGTFLSESKANKRNFLLTQDRLRSILLEFPALQKLKEELVPSQLPTDADFFSEYALYRQKKLEFNISELPEIFQKFFEAEQASQVPLPTISSLSNYETTLEWPFKEVRDAGLLIEDPGSDAELDPRGTNLIKDVNLHADSVVRRFTVDESLGDFLKINHNYELDDVMDDVEEVKIQENSRLLKEESGNLIGNQLLDWNPNFQSISDLDYDWSSKLVAKFSKTPRFNDKTAQKYPKINQNIDTLQVVVSEILRQFWFRNKNERTGFEKLLIHYRSTVESTVLQTSVGDRSTVSRILAPIKVALNRALDELPRK